MRWRPALLAAAMALAAETQAEPGRWLLRSDLLGGANPPGLMAVGGAFRGLERDGRSLEAGLSSGLSPAYGQLSIRAEGVPAPFFILAARADLYRYFGQHDALLSFPSAGAPFGTRQRDALSSQDEAEYGRRFLIQPTLRAKAGRLILINESELARYSFSGRGPYFLELEYDTLMRSWDTLLADRVYALYSFRADGAPERVLAGPYFDFQHVHGSRLERARLGAVLDLSKKRAWRGGDAHLYLLPGFDLRDPNRRHQLYFAGAVGLEFSRP